MKNKILFLLLLIMIAAVTGLPHIIGIIYQKENYSIVALDSALTTHEEVYTYFPRVKQIINGSPIPYDFQTYEYKDSPSPFISETVPSYIMAIFALITGSVEHGFILADFILPPLIFLLAYALIKTISGKRGLALVFSVCLIFTREIFDYFPYPLAIFNYLFRGSSYVDNLIIMRSFHPQASIVIFLLAIFFIYKTLKTQSNKNIIIAGIFFGLTFYNYIFHWTAMTLGLFIFFVFNIRNKSFRNAIIKICLIAFIVAIPYFISLYKFQMSPLAKEFAFRSTGFRTEFPFGRSLRYIAITIILYIAIRKKDLTFYLFNSLILAAAILPDLSLLLMKKDLETSHWIKICVYPLSIIYYPVVIDRYVNPFLHRSFRKIILIILFFSFTYYAVNAQIKTAMKFSRYQALPRDLKEVINILQKLPKNSVILSLPVKEFVLRDKNIIIPAVTDNFIYVPHPTHTIAPTSEILERNLIALSLIRTQDEILNHDMPLLMYGTYSFLNLDYMEKNQKQFKAQVEKIFNRSLHYKKYRVDYVLNNRETKIINNIFKLDKIFQNQKYILYRVVKK